MPLQKNKKNILISIPNARMVRAFLDTDVFDQIVKNEGYHFYVIHNMKSVSTYINQYTNVEEIIFPNIIKESFFIRLCRSHYDIPAFLIRAFKSQYAWQRFFLMKNPSVIKYIKKLVIILGMLTLYFVTLGQYYKIIKYLFYDENIKKCLDSLNLKGVILACPVLKNELLIAQYAELNNIPMVGGADGWDTYLPTSKFLFKFNHLLLWGERMKKYAIKFHGVSESNISLIGVPYIKKLQNFYMEASKEAIKNKFGIPLNHSVILIFSHKEYTCGNIIKKTIHILLDAIESKELENVTILLRVAPNDHIDKEDRYYLELAKKHNNLIVQVPDIAFFSTADVLNNKYIFREVAELFKISSIVMNVVSMCLLEASLCGIKTLMLAFKDCHYPTKFIFNEPFSVNYPKSNIVYYSHQLIPKIIKTLSAEYNQKAYEDFCNSWSSPDNNCRIDFEKILNSEGKPVC